MAEPFPHFVLDNFLDDDFARRVAAAFPTFENAKTVGLHWTGINERNKFVIVDTAMFPKPVLELHETLASQAWLDAMSYVMDIPDLLADPLLDAGGMHVTSAHGFLDPHVDFNYLEQRKLHRRVNILVYFNPDWQEEWGGNIELWDRTVSRCGSSYPPILNRCLVFATSDRSFHGVSALNCPSDVVRKSFAAFYYTTEPPVEYPGGLKATIFRARPNERLKKVVLMPGDQLKRAFARRVRALVRAARGQH